MYIILKSNIFLLDWHLIVWRIFFEIFLQNKLNEHVIDLKDYNEDITSLDLNHLLKVVEDNAQIGHVLFK